MTTKLLAAISRAEAHREGFKAAMVDVINALGASKADLHAMLEDIDALSAPVPPPAPRCVSPTVPPPPVPRSKSAAGGRRSLGRLVAPMPRREVTTPPALLRPSGGGDDLPPPTKRQRTPTPAPLPMAAPPVLRALEGDVDARVLELTRFAADGLSCGGDLLRASQRCAERLEAATEQLFSTYTAAARGRNEASVEVFRVFAVEQLGLEVMAYLPLSEQAGLQAVCSTFAAICGDILSTLRVVSISGGGAPVLDAAVFEFLERRCPKLRELEIVDDAVAHIDPRRQAEWGTPPVSPTLGPLPHSGVGALSLAPPSPTSAMANLLGKCTELVRLQFHPKSSLLTDEAVMSAAANCPRLQTFIMPSSSLSDVGLASITSLAALRHLNIAGCADVTDAAMCEVAVRCVNLHTLNLSKCGLGDSTLALLGSCATALHTLNASWVRNITDRGVQALAGCPTLTALNLSGCAAITDGGLSGLSGLRALDLSRCRLVTDATLLALAPGCPELDTLDVSACLGVTDRGIAAVGAACPKLTKLDVGWGPRVTDASIAVVAEGCPTLRSINLSACVDVSDWAVKLVAQHCRHLRKLRVGWCHNITDTGISFVANTCPRLEKLVVAGCQRVTDASILTIASKCSRLAKLDLTRCPCVSSSGIAALLESPCFTHLECLH